VGGIVQRRDAEGAEEEQRKSRGKQRKTGERSAQGRRENQIEKIRMRARGRKSKDKQSQRIG
jgi:hypothetical protein